MSREFPIRFGKDGAYELTEEALTHILIGEIITRPITKQGVRGTDKALTGGLHTWDGWEEFSKHHKGIVHLLAYDADQHDDWFYARELQNGVITLKIPRHMFTGSAASITMKPDVHYKSGYLWKTLYPAGFSEDDIINALTEAFENLDREDSNYPTAEQPAGVLYGYALIDDTFKAMKLRIQLRGNQIQSAFPAWDQPATGNNGKPYSHGHSINFNVAGSIVNCKKYSKVWGAVFPDDTFSEAELLKLTPAFILQRPRRNPEITIGNWRDMREKELIAVAPLLSLEELQHIEFYLRDYVCSKDPYGIQTLLYLSCVDKIRDDDAFFNAVQFLENVAECIQVLTHSDLELKTRRAMDAIVRFLNMAVVHTGGLCSLMFKRVLGEFVEVAVSHHEKSSLREFFSALAGSPCRATLYTEFNLNPFVMENNEAGWSRSGVEEVDLELGPEHLYEFIELQLGENYMIGFSKEQRSVIARGFFSRPEQQSMVADMMSFLSGIDFQFFIPSRLNPVWFFAKLPPVEEDLLSVVRDYSRMLVIYRQRIVMEDFAAYKAVPDYKQTGTLEFFNLVRQKHKRQFVLDLHRIMLIAMMSYAEVVKFGKLKTKISEMLERLPKEAVPMPKAIPDYITGERKRPDASSGDYEKMVRIILGEDS
ncbi:hypothetical protein [Pseudomonas viridiflava]|uniref:hypothetical protein n=1 Tax=Pseudomonas viridiflava TaxID=33069 RepID=UPI000F033237|nr:hypothetical protein [Pseudomonas viridiflava]QVI85919.1 hypothetical protein KHW14_00720 [Pseudomonas viridiflava]